MFHPAPSRYFSRGGARRSRPSPLPTSCPRRRDATRVQRPWCPARKLSCFAPVSVIGRTSSSPAEPRPARRPWSTRSSPKSPRLARELLGQRRAHGQACLGSPWHGDGNARDEELCGASAEPLARASDGVAAGDRAAAAHSGRGDALRSSSRPGQVCDGKPMIGARRLTPSRPGSAHCRDTSTPMFVSRRSRR
jgi:hypothetical protein